MGKELVQNQEGWREACRKGNKVGVREVLERVLKEAGGASDTAACVHDPGPTGRLTLDPLDREYLVKVGVSLLSLI